MRPWRRAALAALLLAAALALGLCARRWLVVTTRVYGSSMNDTLLSGDVVLVTRFDYASGAPQRGDVVWCTFPGRSERYIKRVIGLPGEAIDCVEGVVRVNGEALSERYVSSATEPFSALLDEDQYLVMGDNRQQSYDSRMEEIGALRGSDFLGRVRWILWPLPRFGSVY